LKKFSVLYLVALALILLSAAVLRFYDLGYRPMHGDEANQAIKTSKLLEKGEYAYDPVEHHGPTLYYLTLPVLWLAGAHDAAEMTEPMIRVVPAFFGLGLVLLSWLIVAPIDRRAGLWAALLTAVSHGLVYYSRYYVQEISFVFFAAGLIGCAHHYLTSRRLGWALGAGLFLGLLHATKETSVLVVFAMVVALACVVAWEKVVARRAIPLNLNWRHIGAGLGLALAISVVFFSSFFTHWRGPLDSLLTYTTYLNRAEGHGSSALHDQPWYYYVSLLAWTYREAGPKWSEGLILGLGFAGGLWSLARPSTFGNRTDSTDRTDLHNEENQSYLSYPSYSEAPLLPRFLALYTLFLIVGFSLIPYKTPWNLLIFLHPLCLLAGLGAQRVTGLFRPRAVQVFVAALLLAGALQLAGQAWRGSFTYGADVRNPYVYAHTSSAIRRLTERVTDLAAVHPRGDQIHINVFRFDGDYWPLPWYLRHYPNVGYWPDFPESPDADVILTAPEIAGALQPRLKQEYQVEMNGLRPGVLMPTFIRKELWDAFMAKRSALAKTVP
jgi:uncharacterized protein (TIGR03663 family)